MRVATPDSTLRVFRARIPECPRSRPAADTAIPPSAFHFLRALARNNNRPWFNANKDRYLAGAARSAAALHRGVRAAAEEDPPGHGRGPEPARGSLFRIYRDTRFAKDKSPYKTQAGMFFAFPGGRESPAPGFYLHVAPGEVFMGAGIWHPQPDTLKQIRDAIATLTRRLEEGRVGPRALRSTTARSSRAPPRGYDPEHPAIEDLKRKSFTTTRNFTETQASANDFADRYAAACKDAVPLMKFLTGAVGQRW